MMGMERGIESWAWENCAKKILCCTTHIIVHRDIACDVIGHAYLHKCHLGGTGSPDCVFQW